MPLQRLFLMNSDFIQVEAEQLAKRVAAEPDNRARIRKAYLLAYGREPSEEEIKLGIEYLHAEPMREYEENKKAAPEGGRGGGRRGPATDSPSADTPEGNEGATGAAGADGAPAAMPMGMGMMGGMMGGGRGGRGGAAAEVKYDASAWGRYAKMLFSSSEFMFIN